MSYSFSDNPTQKCRHLYFRLQGAAITRLIIENFERRSLSQNRIE